MNERGRQALNSLRRKLRPRTRARRAIQSVRVNRFGFRPLHNLVLDLRFGGLCGGVKPNPFEAEGAFEIESSDYSVLTKLYRRNGIVIREEDVLVDVGCGPGRAINWWLHHGMTNRIIGLERVPALAARAAERLRRHPNVEIICANVADDVPSEGTLFYVYNPFDAKTMEAFKEQLVARAARLDEVRILYYNCRDLDVFQRDGRWKIEALITGELEPAALISYAGPRKPL